MAKELECAGNRITLDKEGYLVNLSDWTETVAEAMAAKEDIELTD